MLLWACPDPSDGEPWSLDVSFEVAAFGTDVNGSSDGIAKDNFGINSGPTSFEDFYLLLGFVCYHTQLTQGMFRAARMWLSSLPGGLAIASVFGSAGFAAVSGSSVACSSTSVA